MKFNFKTLGSLILILMIAGCGKKVKVELEESAFNNNLKSNLKSNTDIVVPSLKDRSADEVLNLKYNKAVLSCNLWVQYTKDLDKNLKPNDSFSIDLLKSDISREAIQKLSAQVKDQSVEVNINLKDINIKTTKIVDSNATYRLKNSPVIEMDYSYNSLYKNGRTVLKGSGQQIRAIYEKIIVIPLSHSRQPKKYSKTYFEQLECTIDTEIKTEYSDEFSIE